MGRLRRLAHVVSTRDVRFRQIFRFAVVALWSSSKSQSLAVPMRLPRRVPWEHLGELEQVCSWIYTDENDLEAKQRAVNRVSAFAALFRNITTYFTLKLPPNQLAAWKAAVPLPHALESTHTILSVILQDGTTATSSSYLSLRMSYAGAIIRLVNGLVDPLQLGAYARSIHSIAQQLGLPAWFVELRHAATHEDLPSLEVLRDAARQVAPSHSLALAMFSRYLILFFSP